MVSTLKYALFFTIIIIVASISFAIDEETIIPIFLNIPEYLKITGLPDEPRLDLYANFRDWGDTVEDSLTFNVESNVNYNLYAEFTVLSSLTGIQQNLIEDSYSLMLSSTVGTPGIQDYSLTFQLDVGLLGAIIYNFMEGQIGTIELTVSSN
ncbi:MAG TPA: hypothetical protein DEA49_04920 [Petrotoga sp.]|nr:MAG: Uncharacterized protein XD53_1372 [Petrotoga mobilis]HBT51438.1 hypothetical protein [Petrotoga sp.]